jgi:hypothetical protein
MSTQLGTAQPGVGLLTVEVSDPTGQQTMLLEGIRSSATVNEILSRAMSEMRLPDEVEWNLRDEETSRLLPSQQRIGDVAREVSPHVRVTMQPDAGLG